MGVKRVEKNRRKSIRRSINAYPWLFGFTGDLLFYVAIDTLFLSFVKNFSEAEIVSLASFSQLICILLQFPTLFVIKKIGNTAATRLGAFFLLLSALFITFGPTYFVVLLGLLFHKLAALLNSASIVALENNLDLLDRRSDFVRVRTTANTIYSIITMLISFVASFMFNLYHYLPMIGCITTCTVGFFISLFMKDHSNYNKISYKNQPKQRVKIKWNVFIILAVSMYGLFYTAVSGGQIEGKLFIQQQMLLAVNTEKTVLIIGAIVCVSRIIRVVSNIVFAKLYEKFQEKCGIVVTAMLGLSIGCLLFGSVIPALIAKILVMGLGYTIILFVIDPFKLYMQDVLFANTPKEQHQTLLVVLQFSYTIVQAGVGLIFSAILLAYPMVVVMTLVFVLSIVSLILSLFMYRSVMIGRKSVASE